MHISTPHLIPDMITLKNIEFSYRRHGFPALSGVTADIMPGIYLLAGENGAGKTTLLHLIAGVSSPAVGQCLIDGINAASDCPAEKGRTFLLEENMYFPGRTIRDFAMRHSRFYPYFSAEKFEENLKAFGLSGHEPFKSQSLGNRKKAQLAYALSLGVDVLLLDEPTNALDIQSKDVLRKLLIQSTEENQTVIVATHSPNELENLFDGALFLTRSRLLFAGTEDAVSQKLSFIITRMPESGALYSEIQVGRVLGIYPAACRQATTRVDWRLLYSALHSSQRDAVLKVLSKPVSY